MRRLFILSAVILSGVIVFIYFPSSRVGFFAQDYDFLEPVARLSLNQYLVYYFDPRVQVLWYRPLQGAQILVEYALFGANPVGYHWVNIFFHVVNCLLLFGLVWKISNKWRVGFLAAFFYATFPVYALAVNWINITDPLMTIFYLLAIWCWWNYLRTGKQRDYVLTAVLFGLALLTKQMAISLPAILFLVDWLLVGNPFRIPELVRRYAVIALIAVFYLALQYSIPTTHVYSAVFGYTLGPQIASMLVQYLSLSVFPWGYYPPTDTQIMEGFPFADTSNLVWLGGAIALYLFVIMRYRSRALLVVGSALLLTLLPVFPFPFVELRYLYLPAMASGVLLAILFDHAFNVLPRPRMVGALTVLALALLAIGAALSVANANAGIAEIARQRRVPFRDISAQHTTFPEDTHLYFIDPISPLPELSGMFVMRYGPGVTVGGNQSPRVTNPREYKHAFVYWFDETGKPHEVPVDPAPPVRLSVALPITFQVPIKLDRMEIVQSTVKRGDVLIALFYWYTAERIDRNYTLFFHLVDKNGQMVAGYDSQPRKGDAPTSTWLPHHIMADAIVLPIPAETQVGNDYRLEVGLYYLPTMERFSIVDARGVPIADALMIESLNIIE